MVKYQIYVIYERCPSPELDDKTIFSALVRTLRKYVSTLVNRTVIMHGNHE